MPNCIALCQVPGFHGPSSFDLPTTGQTSVVDVRFTDGPLGLPAGSSFQATVTYDAANRRLHLQARLYTALSVLAGQLELSEFDLTLALTAPANGNVRLDDTAAEPIVASGKARWIGDIPESLGVDNAAIPLELRYVRGSFELAAADVHFSRAFVSCDRLVLKLQAVVTPAERAVILTAEGEGSLDQSGRDKVNAIAAQVFGTAHSAPLSVAFLVRAKFSLDPAGALAFDGRSVSVEFGLPTWVPPKLAISQPLTISIGRPLFHFSPTPPGQALPTLGFRLKDCVLSVPEFEGLSLKGHLDWTKLAGDRWKFLFRPSVAGSFTLPGVLRQFLERIGWSAVDALPSLDLEDIAEELKLSLSELDLVRTFEGLLPDPALGDREFEDWVKDAFTPQFNAVVNAAIGLSLAPDRIFGLAIQVLSNLDAEQLSKERFRKILEAVWALWFDLGATTSIDHLIRLLLGVFRSVTDPERLFPIVEAVCGRPQFDLAAVLRALYLEIWNRPREVLETGLQVTYMLLGAATNVAGRAKVENLARALLASLKSTQRPQALKECRGFADLSLFSAAEPLSIQGFRVPTDSLLTALGLHALLTVSSSEDVFKLLGLPKTFMFLEHTLRPLLDLLERWRRSWPVIDGDMLVPLLIALVNNARGDDDSELVLLQMGRACPPLGVVFTLIAMVASVWRGGLTLLGDLKRDPADVQGAVLSLEDTSGVKVKRLPAPTAAGATGRKYLIFSDVHRDARSDRGQAFEFGAIEHFYNHQQLYCDVLDHAIAAGYTVVENGDCEELWFIRDFSVWQGPKAKVDKTLTDHEEVYLRLATLHKQGRYFRTFGNHDSPLRKPDVLTPLKERMMEGGVGAFEIYDYLIIDGVKTMDDHALLDLAGDVGEALKDLGNNVPLADRLDKAAAHITDGRLGLDSTDYQARKPLIVAHGHQWDFFNCDANNLIGKLVSNCVAVPADMLNDPLEDIQGIAIGGSPAVDFRSLLASVPVFDSFPVEAPAVQFAHGIQHQADKQRLLNDDVIYLESLAALAGMFTLAVGVKEGNRTRTWKEALDSGDVTKMAAHLFNMLAIGHTHYPHNQPYFNLQQFLVGPLADSLIAAVQRHAADLTGIDFTLNFIKSRLLNTGTAGWMEGVIWAIQIEQDGQAHLVFWTRDTRPERPHRMDWELMPMPEAMRRALRAKTRSLAQWLADAARLAGASAAEVASKLGVAALPLAALIRISPELEQAMSQEILLLEERADTRAQIDRIGGWLLGIFLALLRRSLGLGAAGHPASFTLRYPVPGDLRRQIDAASDFLRPLSNLDGAPDPGTPLRAACAFVALRSRSLTGGRRTRLLGEFPLGEALFSLLPLLPASPGHGSPQAEVRFDGGDLVVKLTVA